MPILTQKAALLAKVETTSGTAISTSGTTDAILVSEPMWAIESDEVVRNFTRGDLSNYASIFTMRRATLTFKTEVRGSGTAVTAPDWAVLLRGCGFGATAQSAGAAKTITSSARDAGGAIVTHTATAHALTAGQFVTIAGTTQSSMHGVFQVATTPTANTFTVANAGTGSQAATGGTATVVAGALYTPQTDSMNTLTMRLFWDGIEHAIAGAMGTWKMTAEAGGIGMIEWTFTGTYITPISQSFPSQTLQSLIPPIVGNLDLSWSASASNLFAGNVGIDWGNQIAVRKDVNSAQGMHSVYISGRTPTGSFSPEVSTALNTAFLADWEASTTRPFSTEFGSGAGATVIFSAPAAQITGIGYGDRDNIRTYDLNIALRRLSSAGNDELTLLFP